MTPRLSMIMAISSDGKLYCSFTQVNTDARVFCVFMTRLAEKLSSENKNWRTNTVVLIDGAKYQTCKEA